MQGRQAQAVAEVHVVLGVHALRHDVAGHQQLGHPQAAHAAGGVVAGQDGAAKLGLVDAHLHDGRGGFSFSKLGRLVQHVHKGRQAVLFCIVAKERGSFSDSEMTLVSNRIIQIRWVLPVSCRVQ